MIVSVHATKGGVGVTALAASLALAERDRPVLLVDLAGDLHHALGVDPGDRPGVADWLHSDAAPEQLDQLVIDTEPGVELLPTPDRARWRASAPESRWAGLARWLLDRSAVDGSRVVIDAGDRLIGVGLTDACAHRLLVTRRCYLTLRSAAQADPRPTAAVLVSEAGRSLRRADVEATLRCPVICEIAHDVALANRIDAGLLHVGRASRSHLRALRAVWQCLESESVRSSAA